MHQGISIKIPAGSPTVLLSVCPAVQENHHCALTSLILRQRGSNLLQCFTGEEWQKARRLLIDVILATDMHHHFTLTQELQKHSIIFATDDDADKVLLVSPELWRLALHQLNCVFRSTCQDHENKCHRGTACVPQVS